MNISQENNMEGKEGVDALFLYATEGIIVANRLGEIIKVNPSAERLFGYEKDTLLGQKIEVLIPKRLSDKHVAHRDKFAVNPHARSMGAAMVLHGVKKDGSEFPVEISLSPYSRDNNDYVIAFIVDITLRKQAEEKLKNYSMELERQVKNRTLILEEAIEELEKTKLDLYNALSKERELNELKSRFVSMASHEFRTPLTTMLSSLSLIKRYAETSDLVSQGKHINKIKGSINNLTDILNDFLSVSKLEEGKINYHPTEQNLNLFIADIVSEMSAMAHNGQKFNQTYVGNKKVFIDTKLLKNVLFNLISNAIKFSPENGLIDIHTVADDKQIMISVKDNGIGIPKEDQKHLFERFFRGHNATNIQGTGLGLNIVSKYLELMNASISCSSEENKGTLFIITIPQ